MPSGESSIWIPSVDNSSLIESDLAQSLLARALSLDEISDSILVINSESKLSQ